MVASGKAQLFQAADVCRFIVFHYPPKQWEWSMNHSLYPVFMCDNYDLFLKPWSFPTLAAKLTSIPWNTCFFNCPPCKYHYHFLLMEHEFLGDFMPTGHQRMPYFPWGNKITKCPACDEQHRAAARCCTRKAQHSTWPCHADSINGVSPPSWQPRSHNSWKIRIHQT